MSIQPPQISINVYQTKRYQISSEYSSSNTNGDMLLQDEPLSCLMNSVHWIDGGNIEYIEM